MKDKILELINKRDKLLDDVFNIEANISSYRAQQIEELYGKYIIIKATNRLDVKFQYTNKDLNKLPRKKLDKEIKLFYMGKLENYRWQDSMKFKWDLMGFNPNGTDSEIVNDKLILELKEDYLTEDYSHEFNIFISTVTKNSIGDIYIEDPIMELNYLAPNLFDDIIYAFDTEESAKLFMEVSE